MLKLQKTALYTDSPLSVIKNPRNDIVGYKKEQFLSLQ